MSEKKEKAFHNFKTNGMHLNFPNGNSLSFIWGGGTYCENYNQWEEAYAKDLSFEERHKLMFETPISSNTVEIMPHGKPEQMEKIEKLLEHDFEEDGAVIGYVTFENWLKVVNILAKDV